jgi:glyoxylase-like metal-dependent hydrolase (beta-lactamase superfamily II)
MSKRLGVALALIVFCAGTSFSQGAPGTKEEAAAGGEGVDAKAVLQAAQKAMGNVTSIQYSGTGHIYFFGQAWTPGTAWPSTNLTSYTRTIDYSSKSAQENLIHSEPNPMVKGGGRPFAGDDKQESLVSSDYAWDAPTGKTIPQPAAAAERQLQIWLTPHGFVKAALENNATAVKGALGTEITFEMGKYKVSGTIDSRNFVTKTDTWVPTPVLGDTLIETLYSGYKDFNGVQFPSTILQKEGGQTVLDLTVSDVKANPGLSVSVPDAVKTATPPAIKVTSEKMGTGIWFIAGGSHNSLVVEFPSYITVIEAPLGEARSLAVIAEAKRLAPGKPIKYLINTHAHFDHSGGVRTYVAEGATIITQSMNAAYYQRVWTASRTLAPDNMSKGGKKANFIAVNNKYELTEGGQTLEIYHENGSLHNAGMLIVYFPKEKILEEADDFTPDLPTVPAPTGIRPPIFAANLLKQIDALKLDVKTIAPMHGVVVPFSDLQKAANAGSETSGGKG